MKKHFLLLLMAFFSLTGWADVINLAEADVTLNRTQLDYTGDQTAPVVTAINGAAVVGDLTITYYKKTGTTYTETTAAQVRNAGDYALTLTAGDNGNYTGTTEKVDFTINKGELNITLVGATKVYGDADPTIIEYTWDDITELRGSDDVNNVVITLAFSETARAAGEAVNTTTGYAYNTITATTPNYTIHTSGSPVLFITKRPLIGAYTGTVSKVYGEDDPAFDKTKLTFDGWAEGEGFEDTDAKKAAALTIAADATLAYTGTDANCDPDGTLLTGKALYPITITGVTSANYELTLPAIGMSIKQKSIVKEDGTPAEGVTITATSATGTYNAAKQLIPATNYSVTYKGAAATVAINYFDAAARAVGNAVAEDNVKNAAKYYYQITGNGNFAGVYTGVTTAVPDGLTWEIEQKDLWVYAVDDTKVYDGTAWAATDLTFEYSGLEGDDAVTTGASATIGTTAVPNAANVNEDGYTVTPTTDAMVIKNGETAVTTNYNIQGIASVAKITKRPLKLTANDKEVNLGYATPVAFTATIDEPTTAAPKKGVINNTEKTAIQEAITISLDAALAETCGWNYADAGTYPQAIVITWGTQENPVPDVLKNYEPTVEKGQFKVNGGTFTMIAKNKTVGYGDPIGDFEYLTSGNVALKAGANVTYKIFKGTEEISNPTEVGTYTIKIDEKTSEYLPANYTDINYAPGTLKIDQKALKVVVADQTLSVGQGEAALLQGDKYVTITGLKEGDKVKFAISAAAAFNTAAVTEEPIANAITVALAAPGAGETGYSNANYKILDADITKGKLTVVAAATIVLNRLSKDAYTASPSLDNAVEVIHAAAAEKYDADGAKAYNAGLPGAVSIATVKTEGSPAVPPTYAATLDDAPEAGTTYYTYDGVEYTEFAGTVFDGEVTYYVMTDPGSEAVDPVYYTEEEANTYNAALPGAVAANDAKKFNVTFGDFDMAKERWYSLTLPFATSVKEVSAAFGYAVVDIFDTESNIDNDVMFRLHMGDLNANEPFIFKVYEDINMKDVTFTGKAIVEGEATLTDKTGNKFIGTYSAINGFEPGKKYFFSTNDGNIKRAGSSTFLSPLAAYITTVEVMDGMSAAPRIVIEEPNGETTAIETINIEQQNQDAEGWYNLNGMKLNGAPSQKGVFIKNGKKVIVK